MCAKAPPWSVPGQVLELFSDYLLEHFFVQGQIRHQPAQPDVLFLKLSELADPGGHEAAKFFLPAVKRLLADTHLAGDLGHLRPLLGLLQSKGNLLVGKSGPLHREILLARLIHLRKIFSL
jgi:hypothetical protein